MSRVFFATELEGVATFWRILRTDGVTLGFTSHDRDLWFDGILHRAAPGMLPSSIRRTADLSADSAEVKGALSHDAISATELAAGRFDRARIEVGAVDWETLETATLYSGTIGTVAEEASSFTAELESAKNLLDFDPVPRTTPGCRAQFCGPGCNLSPLSYTQEAQVDGSDLSDSHVGFGQGDHSAFRYGHVRWVDGPLCGLTSRVMAADAGGLVIEHEFDKAIPPGTRALLREGCDHTLATCHSRFANAVNFQGEPFLPGNDLLSQYPRAS